MLDWTVLVRLILYPADVGSGDGLNFKYWFGFSEESKT